MICCDYLLLQLKVAAYDDDGYEMMYMTFNAIGSDRSNWFKQANIIESSYVNIQGNTIRTFSLHGHVYTCLTNMFNKYHKHSNC